MTSAIVRAQQRYSERAKRVGRVPRRLLLRVRRAPMHEHDQRHHEQLRASRRELPGAGLGIRAPFWGRHDHAERAAAVAVRVGECDDCGRAIVSLA